MAHRYIGRNIYELRKKRGWSQSDLARKLDKKTSTISSYETDSKTPSVDTIIAMSELFGVSIEELFFSKNITTGIAVGHGRGVLLCAAERCGIPLFEYTPGQVKMAVTGFGRAEKRQVMDMTKRLRKLAKTPRPDDAADALALALCHARSSTSRLPQIKPEKETV